MTSDLVTIKPPHWVWQWAENFALDLFKQRPQRNHSSFFNLVNTIDRDHALVNNIWSVIIGENDEILCYWSDTDWTHLHFVQKHFKPRSKHFFSPFSRTKQHMKSTMATALWDGWEPAESQSQVFLRHFPGGDSSKKGPSLSWAKSCTSYKKSTQELREQRPKRIASH